MARRRRSRRQNLSDAAKIGLIVGGVLVGLPLLAVAAIGIAGAVAVGRASSELPQTSMMVRRMPVSVRVRR